MKKQFMSISNTEQNGTDSRIDLLVRADKLDLLFRQSFPAIFVSYFIALILSYILWPVQQHSTLIIWLSVLAASSLLRLALFVKYRRMKPSAERLNTWEKQYFLTLLVSLSIWGVGAVIIMPSDSELHQAITAFFLGGMAGGAVSVFSTHRTFMLLSVAVLLLPVTLAFLIEGKPFQLAMAVAIVLFFLSAIRSGKILQQAMHQSFKLTHELKAAKELAEELALTDELTGLNNRRAFYEKGHVLTSLSQRGES
ncbi:MAG: GGDEF domain-containing protein, partial [Gammaproteobacteria bacterium]|nr:GGDEF domain-containing protein [Gammaproteobacteria bacterium]